MNRKKGSKCLERLWMEEHFEKFSQQTQIMIHHLIFAILDFRYLGGHLSNYSLQILNQNHGLMEKNRKVFRMKMSIYVYWIFFISRAFLYFLVELPLSLQYDYSFKLFSSVLSTNMARVASFSAILIGIVVLLIDHLIRIVPPKVRLWEIFYQMTLLNLVFDRRNFEFQWKINDFRYLRKKIEDFIKNHVTVEGPKIVLCPNISMKIKKKIAIRRYLFDIAVVAFIIAVDAITFILYLYFSYVAYKNNFPIIAYFLWFLDVFVFSWSLWFALCLVFSITFCSVMALTMFIGHIREISFSLLLWSRYNHQLKGKFFEKIALHKFLFEHLKITMFILDHNRALFSNIVFVAVLLNIPLNVLFVSRLVFSFNQLVLLAAITQAIFSLGHIVIVGSPFWAISDYVPEIHKPKSFLPKVIALNTQLLTYKLKCLFLYERLNSSKKYGITMQGATITHRFCVKVCFK